MIGGTARALAVGHIAWFVYTVVLVMLGAAVEPLSGGLQGPIPAGSLLKTLWYGGAGILGVADIAIAYRAVFGGSAW